MWMRSLPLVHVWKVFHTHTWRIYQWIQTSQQVMDKVSSVTIYQKDYFSQLLDLTQLLTLRLNHYIKSLAVLARSWAKQYARTMNICAHTSVHCFSIGLKETEILSSLFLWNVPYDFFFNLYFLKQKFSSKLMFSNQIVHGFCRNE